MCASFEADSAEDLTLAQLKARLDAAIDEEEYEAAAQIRDEIS